MPRGKKPQPLHILCAPGAFKECMCAPEAAAAMARGVQRAANSLGVEITSTEHPLSDGGADFLECWARRTPNAHSVDAEVGSPLGEEKRAALLIDDARAVLQLSSAAGLAQTGAAYQHHRQSLRRLAHDQ